MHFPWFKSTRALFLRKFIFAWRVLVPLFVGG